ncbi:MAG: hypothetical protein ACFFAJ_06100 [Candidatus Hodarchaeota archaeon]
MESIHKRNPTIEILKKVGAGIALSIFILIIYLILNGESFTFQALSLGVFMIGGMFLVIGGLRDIFGSVLISRLKGQEIEDYMNSPNGEYLFGFGKAGEDVIAGFVLLFISFLISTFFNSFNNI